jgi:hypothetical protein
MKKTSRPARVSSHVAASSSGWLGLFCLAACLLPEVEYEPAGAEPSASSCAEPDCATIAVQPGDGSMVPSDTPATSSESQPSLVLAPGQVGVIDGGPACVSETRGLDLPELAVYLMLDSSGSMAETTGTIRTKWDAVQRAIRGFLVDMRNDEHLLLGMQFFPLLKPGVTSLVCQSQDDCGAEGGPCFLATCRNGGMFQLCRSDNDCPGGPEVNPCVTFGLCSESDPAAPLACVLGEAGSCGAGLGECKDFERTCTNATSCEPARYAAPAVEIGPISSATSAIDQALQGKSPEGLTPTVPALQGAVEHAREWARSHPDQTVAIVLATDGLPTECGVQQQTGGTEVINQVLSIAREGASGDTPIRTFVIGVFQPGDRASINNVDAIAEAGGTAKAVFIDASGSVESQFQDALRAIVGSAAACQLSIDSGSALDFSRARLSVDDGMLSGATIDYVQTPDGCTGSPYGWYYDISPDLGTPSAIGLCPGLCERVRPPSTTALYLQIGCAARPE